MKRYLVVIAFLWMWMRSSWRKVGDEMCAYVLVWRWWIWLLIDMWPLFFVLLSFVYQHTITKKANPDNRSNYSYRINNGNEWNGMEWNEWMNFAFCVTPSVSLSLSFSFFLSLCLSLSLSLFLCVCLCCFLFSLLSVNKTSRTGSLCIVLCTLVPYY